MGNDVKYGYTSGFCVFFWFFPPIAFVYREAKSVDVKTAVVSTERRAVDICMLCNPMYPTVLWDSGLNDFMRENYDNQRVTVNGAQYSTIPPGQDFVYGLLRQKYFIFFAKLEEKNIPEEGQNIVFVQREGECEFLPTLKILPGDTFRSCEGRRDDFELDSKILDKNS